MRYLLPIVILAVGFVLGWVGASNQSSVQPELPPVPIVVPADSGVNQLPSGLILVKSASFAREIVTTEVRAIFDDEERTILTLDKVENIVETENKKRKEGGYFSGACFEDVSLSPDREVVIFSVSCEPGDLAYEWTGIYDIRQGAGEFLVGGAGSRFRWDSDSNAVAFTTSYGVGPGGEGLNLIILDENKSVSQKVTFSPYPAEQKIGFFEGWAWQKDGSVHAYGRLVNLQTGEKDEYRFIIQRDGTVERSPYQIRY